MFRVKSCFWLSPKCFSIPKVKFDFQIMDWEFRSLCHKKSKCSHTFIYSKAKSIERSKAQIFFMSLDLLECIRLKVLITPSILTLSMPRELLQPVLYLLLYTSWYFLPLRLQVTGIYCIVIVFSWLRTYSSHFLTNPELFFSWKNVFSVYFLLFPYPKIFPHFFSSHWKK